MRVCILIVLTLATAAYGKLAPLHPNPNAVQSRYLVKIKNTGRDAMNEFRLALVAENDKNALMKTGFGHVKIIKEIDGKYLKMFTLELDYKSLQMVRKHPAVEYVEEEGRLVNEGTGGDDKRAAQQYAVIDIEEGYFGLDRINQENLPLDGNLTFKGDGFGVNVYIVDSGIQLLHPEFECRAKLAYDVLGNTGEDCSGHGTPIASVAVGEKVGVAKAALVHAVRVVDCDDDPSLMSNYIEGMEWIAEHGVAPCVAVLTQYLADSPTLEGSANRLTKPVGTSSEGCVVVAAAGSVPSGGQDACNLSPGRSHSVITVAATNVMDGKPEWSNYGTCVDIFAPGHGVTTAVRTINDDDPEYTVSYGTSIAAGFVAGVAAIHLERGVAASDVKDQILSDSTSCVLHDEGRGSPNRLLFIEEGLPDPKVVGPD